MGFNSIDDLVAEITGGKTWRSDWNKIYAATNVYAAGTVVAGRWYDMTGYGQNEYAHGNFLCNGHFTGGLACWTPGSANISWDAANTAASKTGGSAETITQNTTCVNGTSYSVVYTIAGYAGSGNVTISLGGTAGTGRAANGTYRETIACGATASAPCVVTFASTVSAGRVDNIVITRDLAFTAYSDAGVGSEVGIWHGGNVTADTKHLTTIGCWTNTAASAGAMLYLVDLLGAYPRIRTDLATTQTLANTITIPRYTDGKGVRAFFSNNTTNGAGAQNFTYSYTNTAPTAGRTPSTVISNTASCITSHMSHTGTATGNFGPFLPMAAGDAGILTVESCQFSAASAGAGFIDLMLCKPIVALPITTAFVAAERDLLTQLPSLPRIYDGACLGMIIHSGAVIGAGAGYQGYCEFAWG